MWTLHYRKLGSFHDLTDSEAEEAKEFYKLFLNYLGIWQNKRCDVFMWEKEENNEPRIR